MVAAGLAMWYVGEDGGSMAGHEHEAVEAVKMCVALGNDVNAATRRARRRCTAPRSAA